MERERGAPLARSRACRVEVREPWAPKHPGAALGNPNGAENPELSSAVGGLTLSRNITLNDSTDAVAAFGTIGSRAAAGSATTTYSGNISIAASVRGTWFRTDRKAPLR